MKPAHWLQSFKDNRSAREASLLQADQDKCRQVSLAPELGFTQMHIQVQQTLLSRSSEVGVDCRQLCEDPAVQALGRMGIALRNPLRGIQPAGRDNRFVALIQDVAEGIDFREESGFGANLATKDAARVVRVHDALPENMRQDFLTLATQRVCYFEHIQRTAIKPRS